MVHRNYDPCTLALLEGFGVGMALDMRIPSNDLVCLPPYTCKIVCYYDIGVFVFVEGLYRFECIIT